MMDETLSNDKYKKKKKQMKLNNTHNRRNEMSAAKQ